MKQIHGLNARDDAGVRAAALEAAWDAGQTPNGRAQRPRLRLVGSNHEEVVMYQKPTLQRFGTFREVSDWVCRGLRRRAAS